MNTSVPVGTSVPRASEESPSSIQTPVYALKKRYQEGHHLKSEAGKRLSALDKSNQSHFGQTHPIKIPQKLLHCAGSQTAAKSIHTEGLKQLSASQKSLSDRKSTVPPAHHFRYSKREFSFDLSKTFDAGFG